MTKRQFTFLSLSIITIFVSCTSSSKLNRETGLPNFSKVANCGSEGILAETNIAAFKKVIAEGVTTVQFSLIQNKEKDLIITSGSLKSTDKLRFADLIDSVRTLYMTMKRPPLQYIVVLKAEQMKDGIAEELMKVVNDKGISADLIIASTDIKTLQAIHAKFPEMRIALIARGDSQSSFRKQLKDLGFDPGIYEAEKVLVNDALIRDCRSRGISLFAWTVDDKDEIKKLVNMGVAGIVTNYPEYF